MQKGNVYIPLDFELVRVVDADTIIINIDLGFDVWIRNEYIRLYDFDAVELRSKTGREARDYVVDWFKGFGMEPGSKGSDCDVLFLSMEYKRGKYGRALGDFKFDDVDAPLLTVNLRDAGFEKEKVQ